VDLFRQSVYSWLAGYEDLHDVARLARDPTFRLMGSQQVWERGVALTSTLHWFETDLLAREKNLTRLARLNRELVAQAEAVGSSQWVVLNMDSSEGSWCFCQRVANQGRQRIERSEVIQRGEVLVGRQVGGERQTRPVSGTAQ